MIYLKGEEKVTAIDYRSCASLHDATGETWPSAGHRAVAVPGTVAGLSKALEEYGTLSLAQVIEPAAKIAEEGFPVAPPWGVISDNFKRAMDNEYLMSIIAPTGLPLEAGDVYKNADLAKTLRMIGAGGPEVFYKGEIAKLIAEDMAAHGGLIDEADLAAYRAVEREPARGTYRGYDVVSAPPPVGGFLLIQALNMIENYDIRSMGFYSAQKLHLFSEVLARAFDDYYDVLGDPDFVDVPLKTLTSKEYAAAKNRSIKLDEMTVSYEKIDPNSEHWSTTHPVRRGTGWQTWWPDPRRCPALRRGSGRAGRDTAQNEMANFIKKKGPAPICRKKHEHQHRAHPIMKTARPSRPWAPPVPCASSPPWRISSRTSSTSTGYPEPSRRPACSALSSGPRED